MTDDVTCAECGVEVEYRETDHPFPGAFCPNDECEKDGPLRIGEIENYDPPTVSITGLEEGVF